MKSLMVKAGDIQPKNHYSLSKILPIVFLTFIFSSLFLTTSSAQRTGAQAEMDRLEQQSNDLAAQNDSEGAALAIGKAAMMADLLTKDSHKSSAEKIFQGASHHFRGQEFGLRALALFERAGGQPPASAGVCHYLVQGKHKLQQAKRLLEDTPGTHDGELQIRKNDLLEKNTEWAGLLLDLHQDFSCINTLNE